MYFIFVSNDIEAAQFFEDELHIADAKKILITIPNGYDLIQFLQNVKKGESYPDLIILTPEFLRLSGMDLLELLKTDDFYRIIPVVMLLTENNNDQEAFCTRLGAEFITAPKNKSEWADAINKMCVACA
jgi:CheY-like chemotaxis protein